MNKLSFCLVLAISFFSCTPKDSVPIYDYYKNIPIIRGWTSDDEQRNLMIEVFLVYREDNSELQTKINNLKPSLIDALRGYFTSLKEEDYVVENQPYIKKHAVMLLNDVILDSMSPKKADELRKKTDINELDLILDLNIMQLQIFSLN